MAVRLTVHNPKLHLHSFPHRNSSVNEAPLNSSERPRPTPAAAISGMAATAASFEIVITVYAAARLTIAGPTVTGHKLVTEL